jgi:hypothetical protein
MKLIQNRFQIWALIAISGWLAVWVPWMLAGAVRNMIDGMKPISFLLLGLLGLFARMHLPLRSWQVAAASVTAFPIWALVDAALHPDTHNLLGLEIILYGFFGIPPLVGAVIGKWIEKGHSTS